MKTAQYLYNVLNALIFLIIITICIGLIITIFYGAGILPETIQVKSKITDTRLSLIEGIFVLLGFLVYAVFTYGLFKLRSAAKLFINSTIYEPELGRTIKIAGKCMIISGICWWFIDGFSSLIIKDSLSIALSEKTFVYLFFIMIGFFMMLIEQVFIKAIQLKNENDLTI